MSKNLVIVESPAKAKTIESYLGKDFEVKSSYGHVRDLPKKKLGVDVDDDFEPTYEISPDKVKIVSDLKKSAKGSEVWLATDDDREGEAISWHLKESLGLPDDTKRIVFREITKSAITKAIENPRTIDMELVNAQQARRVLDRLVGFKLSPILWKKITGTDRKNLSAGRVQSVAVRIIVEREREIESFVTESSYKVIALFKTDKNKTFKAEISKNFADEKSAVEILEASKSATFTVKSLEVKPSKKNPSPPFTTSTLQQEAARKLGFSVSQTMTVAQKLYESGKITYMRTDSTNLSKDAVDNAVAKINKDYGDKFVKVRAYKTEKAGAQEAHEAIRPTNFEENTIKGEKNEKRLYELIWKRAIASQMASAEIERTIAKISLSNREEEFTASGEVIKFEGFLSVYLESSDEELADNENDSMLPKLSKGENLNLIEMRSTEKFTRPPARYTEASLVKKLEELGIGRPSTYAPTISTILKRNYIVKEDRPGMQRKYKEAVLKDGQIVESELTENYGSEKNKLFPTNVGTMVNDYLVENFENVLDFKFTAEVEDEFDNVAEGKTSWQKMIKDFYGDFNSKIEKAEEKERERTNSYELGIEPKSGKPLFAKIGRYGPYLQIGEASDEEKPTFVNLKKGTLISSLTFDEAMEVINGPQMPIELGLFEGEPLLVNEGRYGPYVKHNNKFYNIPKGEDPYAVTKERAIEIIEEKRNDPSSALPREMDDYEGKPVVINKGRYGVYIKFGDVFINLPKEYDPLTITNEEVAGKIEEYKEKESKKIIKSFPENPNISVVVGRYGPYIKAGKRNVKIPKDMKPEELTLEDCLKLADA